MIQLVQQVVFNVSCTRKFATAKNVNFLEPSTSLTSESAIFRSSFRVDLEERNYIF